MVDMINSLNPDIIFIAGDLIDGDISPFNKQSMADELKRLNPKYGVFFSPGNHERYEGHLEDIAKSLSEAGINVLMDRSLKVADSFYIIGREDIEANRRGTRQGKSLMKLTESIDKSLPVILLDHQPSKLEEPAAQGIDLQLSGHTHKGQMVPV
jgi:predicted MPP superfamily phosphohydrolase